MRKFLFIPILFLVVSCSEYIDKSARYVFTGNTVISYLEKYPESYSMYTELLRIVSVSNISETTVAQLLSARGHYTVFAPTNEAILAYLDTLVSQGFIKEPSWEAFDDSILLDSIRKAIVLNSIIDSGDNKQCLFTYDFPIESGGEFSLPNMKDNKLSVYYSDNPDSLFINKDCPINIRNRDIELLNGIIHQMEKVIAPTDITAAVFLNDVVKKGQGPYLVMARVIEACGFLDTLNAIRDEKYEDMYQKGLIPGLTHLGVMGYSHGEGLNADPPKHRKYGFTIFAEKDDYWKEQGIDPLDPELIPKIQQWIVDNHQYSDIDVFSVDEKYEEANNLLNQWVSYHILPMRIPVNKIVFHGTEYGYNASTKTFGASVCEYYTSFGKRRLMKLYESKNSNGIFINRFPLLDNKRKGLYTSNPQPV